MRPCFTILLLVVLGLSCKDEGQRGQLLEFTPRELDIRAGLNPILAHFFVVGPVSTEHARFESITSTPWEDWTRIEPARASLLINESGLNWDFVLEVSLKAYTDDPERAREIFYRDQIPRDIGNRLDLIPTDFDAKEGLLDAPEVTLLLELTRLQNSPPQTLPVVIQYSFEAFKE